ncbi:putative enoyl-CoA hydratase [Aquisphaera giovannonii]|uniref:Enoyl-CoA hydratase domain-containing protein 3, mitochondrial n=1 Tax=Aquisphaera giovannonii TaxID=406548 RepID=A0A5B9VZB2_9BACT|nr:enoyl-CoA hydratase [Aquisphaera giovannonii]QEH33663.1 putative enoyl-CoA hydratase [Aquisphaera giovannonii]
MRECLVEESDGPVCRLTINRPERRNALSMDLLSRLEAAIARLREDATIRVVVIAGAGPVFSAGHDLAEMAGLSETELRGLFELCTRVMLGLRRMPQPVIARVHGLATAAGCQLAAACDLVVAAESASFATPGVKIGLFCTTPMIPLVRSIPAKAAMEMLMTASPISARRAFELGLANRVVADAELDAAVHSLCETMLALSPKVLAVGKRAFYELEGLDELTAYRKAVGVMVENASCEDARRGISAFLRKQPPRWCHQDNADPQ